MVSLRSSITNFFRDFHQRFSLEKILVIGDSHVEVFSHRNFIQAFPLTYFRVCSVGGATASGLENPNSTTQAFKKFDEALHQKDYDKILVMLGEVDTGFVIWYRAKKYQADVNEMLKETVDTYIGFIKTLQAFGPVVVISTPLPTIDDSSRGEVANARREVEATQRERTVLTLEFNRQILQFCQDQNINYLDLDEECLGEDDLVRSDLKHKDPGDHHYDIGKYSKMLIDRLKACI